MELLGTAVLLGLFSVTPSGEDVQAGTSCVKEAYQAPDGELEKELSDSEQPLHEAGSKLIRNFICNGRERCLEKHGERLTQAAFTVVDVCLEDPDIPKYMCLGLVANIANEGGGVEHPSCGSLSKTCVLRCDRIWNNGARNDCFKQCAIDQGITRGGARWKRIARCNDRGTSRGPFQMKKGRINQCKKLLGEEFDPFSLEQAARCTAQIVKLAALSDRWPCGRVANRWLVAHKRVTRGVIRVVSKAKPGRFVYDTHGGRKWIEPVPRVVERICTESSYGLRGLRYYRACGEKCTLVKYKPPERRKQPSRVLSLGETAPQ